MTQFGLRSLGREAGVVGLWPEASALRQGMGIAVHTGICVRQTRVEASFK